MPALAEESTTTPSPASSSASSSQPVGTPPLLENARVYEGRGFLDESRRDVLLLLFKVPLIPTPSLPGPSHHSTASMSLMDGIANASMCSQFISSRGNEYFCEIDEDYLTDRFNLTGLNTEVQYYQYALDLVTDVFDLDCDDDMRETIEKSARHLYGLVHARYIVTTRGLAKMVGKPTPLVVFVLATRPG